MTGDAPARLPRRELADLRYAERIGRLYIVARCYAIGAETVRYEIVLSAGRQLAIVDVAISSPSELRRVIETSARCFGHAILASSSDFRGGE